jgi:hypothetical protein
VLADKGKKGNDWYQPYKNGRKGILCHQYFPENPESQQRKQENSERKNEAGAEEVPEIFLIQFEEFGIYRLENPHGDKRDQEYHGAAEQVDQPHIAFAQHIGKIGQQQEGYAFSKKVGESINTQRPECRVIQVL